ncbi:MAG: hypothetical protein ACK50N_01755, partial [Flavobacteriales bacterium]
RLWRALLPSPLPPPYSAQEQEKEQESENEKEKEEEEREAMIYGLENHRKFASTAARLGFLSLLKWVIEEEGWYDIQSNPRKATEICRAAARGGHTEDFAFSVICRTCRYADICHGMWQAKYWQKNLG